MAKPPRKPSGPSSRPSLRAPSARDRFTIRPRKSSADDAEDKPRRAPTGDRATLQPAKGVTGKPPRADKRPGKPAEREVSRPARPNDRNQPRPGELYHVSETRPARAGKPAERDGNRAAKPYADRPAKPYTERRAEKPDTGPKRFGDRTRARVEAQNAARTRPRGDDARPADRGTARPYATRPQAEAAAPRPDPDRTRAPRAERPTSRPAPAARIPAEPKAAPRPTAPHIDAAAERICKLLARAGVASRRDSEKLIAEGRVSLNGEVVTTPATILTSLKGVTVDGAAVSAPEATRLFAFHKPDGLITAARDPAGRPTIYSALRNALPPGAPRVMPIGRLDFSTEGLLLLTNDGEFKRLLELPSTGVPRTYRARTFGDVSQAQLETLIEGVEIDGFRYGKVDANLERRTGRNQWVEVTLTEGKNREVRRVLEYLGLEVSRLIRTSYGPFPLGDLRRGAAYEIPQDAIERFAKTLKPKKKPDPAA